MEKIERGTVTFNLKNNRSVNIRLVGSINIEKKEAEDDSGTASSNSSPRGWFFEELTSSLPIYWHMRIQYTCAMRFCSYMTCDNITPLKKKGRIPVADTSRGRVGRGGNARFHTF